MKILRSDIQLTDWDYILAVLPDGYHICKAEERSMTYQVSGYGYVAATVTVSGGSYLFTFSKGKFGDDLREKLVKRKLKKASFSDFWKTLLKRLSLLK